MHANVDKVVAAHETLDNVPGAAAGDVAREEAENPARNGLVAVDEHTITAEVAAGRAAAAVGEERPADGRAHLVGRNVVVHVEDLDLVGRRARRAAVVVAIEPVDLESGVVPLDAVLVHLSVGRLKVLLRLAEQPRARQQETADLEARLVTAVDRRAVHDTNVAGRVRVVHVTLALVLGRLVRRSVDRVTEALEDLVHVDRVLLL